MQTIIVFAAAYLHLVIVALAVLVWLLASREQKIRIAVHMALSLAVAFIFVTAADLIWYDPRPFVLDGQPPLVPHDATSGFPSEHTTYSFAVAFVIFAWSRYWGIGLSVLAAVVAWGRVAAHVHSTKQVLAGVAVAAIAVVGAWLLSRTLIRSIRKSSVPQRTESGISSKH